MGTVESFLNPDAFHLNYIFQNKAMISFVCDKNYSGYLNYKAFKWK